MARRDGLGNNQTSSSEQEVIAKPKFVRSRHYRHRDLVEVFFHTLKSFRRIATRYEKTARNYLALIHFTCALQGFNAQG